MSLCPLGETTISPRNPPQWDAAGEDVRDPWNTWLDGLFPHDGSMARRAVYLPYMKPCRVNIPFVPWILYGCGYIHRIDASSLFPKVRIVNIGNIYVCQISEKKKHEKNIDYYLNWHWQDKSSLLGAYVLWYKFPGNKKTKTANFFFSEPGKGCIGCCVLNKKTCDLAGGVDIAEDLLETPWNISEELSPFLLTVICFRHTLRRKKNIAETPRRRNAFRQSKK